MAHQDLIKIIFYHYKSVLSASLLIICFSINNGAHAKQAQPVLPSELIVIHNQKATHQKAKNVPFCVEIADDPAEWQKGLMFRKILRNQNGMLFLYPNDDYHSMWMKNTPLSLDMLFIDARGKIVHIEKNTTPFSKKSITPPKPVRAVLELRSGSVKRFGIKPGQAVHHRAFGLEMALTCTPTPN